MLYTYNGTLPNLKKERNPDMCMVPLTGGTHLEESNSETESRRVVARDWAGQGREALLFNGFCKMKRVLEIDGGDGCKI